MAKNQVQRGDVLTFSPVPAGGVVSGQGLLINNLFGVCQTDASAGGVVEAAVEGCFNLAADGPIAMGAAVYWIAATGLVTATAGTNKRIGVAAESASGGFCVVKLCPPAVANAA
jgi:predicted RecA/RadA family phage recombinase